jgi:hypothetical protein
MPQLQQTGAFFLGTGASSLERMSEKNKDK